MYTIYDYLKYLGRVSLKFQDFRLAQVLLDEFQIVNHFISWPKEDVQEFWAAPIAPSYKLNVDEVVFS